MTITFECTKSTFEQIKKQFNKLVDVIKIVELCEHEAVFRELVLVKLILNKKNKDDILDIVNIYRGNIINYNKKSIIIELTGDTQKIDAFNELISAYEVKELVRTGFTGLLR